MGLWVLLHPRRIQSRSPALISAAALPRRRRDNDSAKPFLCATRFSFPDFLEPVFQQAPPCRLHMNSCLYVPVTCKAARFSGKLPDVLLGPSPFGPRRPFSIATTGTAPQRPAARGPLRVARSCHAVADPVVVSIVAWIGAEMEFALSQAVASGDTFEHRPSECGHCVQDFLADLDLRDLPGEAAGFELGADDTLPTADLRFYPAALVVPCGHLPGHAAVAADLGNMAIPNGWSRADCGRVTAFFGGGITTSRVSPYRSLSRSRVDAPS